MPIKLKETNKAVFNFVQGSIVTDGESKTLDLKMLSSKMDQFSDEELRLTAMMEGKTSGDIWPVAIALSNSELGRRASAETEKLMKKVTRWSVGVGGATALAAAIVGALLSN